MLRPGYTLENKYKILELIGEGGMSKVWLARDLALNKSWAIKEINKASSAYKYEVNEAKTLSEIEILKKLDHPSLPRIVSVVNDPTMLCVVMDYIEGETLLDILRTQGPQAESQVAKWGIEICDILDYLHKQNPPIIYRDMKPSNIILNYDDKVKIIDFGIAREHKGGKTGDTMPLGTNGYASPEHRTKQTDARSDIYSLGVTLFQLLTGVDPATLPVKELPPIRDYNPELSTGLEKIILKATRFDPTERYQTAGEMANAIASYKKLEESYIESLRLKLRNFRRLAVLTVIFLILGSSLVTADAFLSAHNYNALMSNTTTNTEKRAEELKRAIDIKPRKKGAYLELIKVYSKDGKFTEREAEDVLSVYNSHRADLERGEMEYAEISYAMGEAILQYYTGETDNSARAKLIAAEPYFRSACVDGFAKKALAEGYVFMANYYTDFVLADASLVAKEAGKEEYRELLEKSSSIIKELKSYDGEGAEKMKVITFEIILNLIDTERVDMMDAGVKASDLMVVIDEIEKESDKDTRARCEELKKSISASEANAKKGEKRRKNN